MDIPLFYKSKPIFGLDIGRRTVKLTQLKPSHGKIQVVGYGQAQFDESTIHEGEIVKPELVTQAIQKIIKNGLVGKISSNRAVLSVPSAHTFTRVMEVPSLAKQDLAEAVRLEAEQYIPVPSQELYIEHYVLEKKASTNKDAQSSALVLIVAVAKKIIDSHVKVCEQLGLEVAALEPSMFANLRSVHHNCPQTIPKIVIDFGEQSSDLAIYDTAIRLTSTVSTGGENITSMIASGFNISSQEAHHIKVRYGIAKSKWQVQLANILQPVLSDFANEVQKTMRYYHQQSGGKNITDIFMVGGGANMPGLVDFLSHLTGVRVQVCNPWSGVSIKPLAPPHPAETTIYATSIGLALKEVIDNG